MAPPKKSRKRGYQQPGTDLGGKKFLGPALVAVAAFAIVMGLYLFLLKGNLVKPGRILDAAEDSGLYGRLPRLIWLGLVTGSPIDPAKPLQFGEADIERVAGLVFDEDYVYEELENLVYNISDVVEAGQDTFRLTLDIAPAKDNFVNVLSAEVKKVGFAKLPHCGSGNLLCKPRGASEFQFNQLLKKEVRKAVDSIPSQYPLPPAAAEGIRGLMGAIGTLGVLAILLLVVGVGAGAAGHFVMAEDSPDPIPFIGYGLAAGGGLGIIVTFAVKGAVAGGVSAALGGLAVETADALGGFLSGAVGGAFTSGLIVAVLAALAGGGVIWYAKQ